MVYNLIINKRINNFRKKEIVKLTTFWTKFNHPCSLALSGTQTLAPKSSLWFSGTYIIAPRFLVWLVRKSSKTKERREKIFNLVDFASKTPKLKKKNLVSKRTNQNFVTVPFSHVFPAVKQSMVSLILIFEFDLSSYFTFLTKWIRKPQRPMKQLEIENGDFPPKRVELVTLTSTPCFQPKGIKSVEKTSDSVKITVTERSSSHFPPKKNLARQLVFTEFGLSPIISTSSPLSVEKSSSDMHLSPRSPFSSMWVLVFVFPFWKNFFLFPPFLVDWSFKIRKERKFKINFVFCLVAETIGLDKRENR